MALSVKGELYFCGRHATEEAVLTPLKIAVPYDVALIAAIRGCSISAFKTNSGRVYYWGYAFGHHVFEPVATKYEHIIRLFASLDSPMMVGPVRCHVNQPMTEKLKLIFDDSVSYTRSMDLIEKFSSFLEWICTVFYFRRLLISRSLWGSSVFMPIRWF